MHSRSLVRLSASYGSDARRVFTAGTHAGQAQSPGEINTSRPQGLGEQTEQPSRAPSRLGRTPLLQSS